MRQKSLKILTWSADAIVGIAIVLYLVVCALNGRDQAPSATVIRLTALYRDRPVVADQDNAFADTMGFDVAPDLDPHAVGLERLAWIEQSSRNGGANAGSDPLGTPYDFAASRDARAWALMNACRAVDAACLTAIEQGGNTLTAWLAAEPWLLKRYQSLIGRRGWREKAPYRPEEPQPQFAGVLSGQMLLLAQAKALIDKQDFAAARDLLSRDARFWRMVLASADVLSTKMVATAALKRHLELGNILLRAAPAGLIDRALPAEWREPLTDSELSMSRCVVGEWRFAANSMQVLANASNFILEVRPALHLALFRNAALSRLSIPRFQPQDTSNRFASVYVRESEMLDTSLARFPEAVQRIAKLLREMAEQPPRLDLVYNYPGKTLLAIGAIDFGAFGARVSDLEGVRRAVLAAAQLRDAKVSGDDIATALAASTLRNPYDDAPFEWDGRQNAVVFRGLESGTRGTHTIFR